MELVAYLKLINKKKQTLLSMVLFFVILSLILTFSQPFKYRAKALILVKQDFPTHTDPYTVIKGNEQLSHTLAAVFPTNIFKQELLNILQNNKDEYDFVANTDWPKFASARAIDDSGVIELKILSVNKMIAAKIMSKALLVMTTRADKFYGGGQKITINIAEPTQVSKWPASPNIFFNVLVGVFFGLIIALTYIYHWPESDYDLRFWPRYKLVKVAENKALTNNVGVGNDVLITDKKLDNYSIDKENNISHNYLKTKQEFLQAKKLAARKNNDLKTREINQYNEEDDDLSYESVMKRGNMSNVLGQTSLNGDS